MVEVDLHEESDSDEPQADWLFQPGEEAIERSQEQMTMVRQSIIARFGVKKSTTKRRMADVKHETPAERPVVEWDQPEPGTPGLLEIALTTETVDGDLPELGQAGIDAVFNDSPHMNLTEPDISLGARTSNDREEANESELRPAPSETEVSEVAGSAPGEGLKRVGGWLATAVGAVATGLIVLHTVRSGTHDAGDQPPGKG